MLVLRRKAGEAIVLNGVITIYVLAVEGERVKLGISAPPEVVIVRSELLEGQAGAPGASLPGGPPPAPRETPRPYIQREHEGGSRDENLPRGRDRERDAGHQANSARAGFHRRGPGESSPAAPIGSGPLRLQ